MPNSDSYNFDMDNEAGVQNQPKSIYAGDIYGGQPSITTTDEGIFIAGSKTNVIQVTKEFGVHLTGDISLSANPNQIVIGGGYWSLNPLLLSCLPSTSATPIPVLVRTTPKLLNSKDSLDDCLSMIGSNGL
jgi:hypothetical protein